MLNMEEVLAQLNKAKQQLKKQGENPRPIMVISTNLISTTGGHRVSKFLKVNPKKDSGVHAKSAIV